MPKISRVTLEHGSVADSLSQIKQDILPYEIASDPLAQWVMSFDELENQDYQRDFRMGELYQHDRYDGMYLLCHYLSASILQTQMPFYFASLFHIGRQWQVAVFFLESINDVEEEENLYTSARNLARLSQQERYYRFNLDLSENSSVDLLKRMCRLGREQQSRQLNLAREWWGAWKNEVGSYQRIVNEIQKYFDSFDSRERIPNEMVRLAIELLALSMQSSSLRGQMQQHEVRFKPQTATQTPAIQQHWWLLLALALLNSDTKDHYHVDYWFEVLADRLRAFQFAPQIAIALEILKRKYEVENPFMRYGVGKSAPTLELLDLIREHRLPDGSDSPWLSSWKMTLDLEPKPYWDKLLAPGTQPGDFQVLSVRSADSTIKRNLTDQSLPAESWEGFLQRIFEKKWIQPVGMMAEATNKETQLPTLPWNLHTFQQFITDVVIGLNKMGYSLTVPDATRLAKLLEEARMSTSLYKDIIW